MANYRIKVPESAARGAVVEIRAMVMHPMENGFNVDSQGTTVPVHIITDFACRYLDAEVLRVKLQPGLAANPYFSFYLKAERSGDSILYGNYPRDGLGGLGTQAFTGHQSCVACADAFEHAAASGSNTLFCTTTTPDLLIDLLHGLSWPYQVMGLDGGIDNPFQLRAKPPVALLRTGHVGYETRCLRGGSVSRNEPSHGAGGQPESLRRRVDAHGHRSITLQRIANDGFTLLRLGPVRRIDDAELLEALIELRDRESRQPPQFGDENLSKFSGAGFLNPCANAF
jgi:sulfur-oxidizing protein SoxZ